MRQKDRNMLRHEVVSITPAIVDIACDLTGREQVYLELCALLTCNPGEWKAVHDKEVIEQLLGLVAQVVNFSINEDFESLSITDGVDIAAGSTGLNMLSALTKRQRKASAIISTVGADEKGNPDSVSTFFTKDVERTGIYQYAIPKTGVNPLVLVFSHKEQPDKVTAMHPGVASQLETLPSSIDKARVVHVDAYDLQREPAALTLDNLIKSNKPPIALGLGNPSILQGQLKERILGYIENRQVHYLMGNAEEYAALFGTEPVTTLEQATSLNLGKLAPYVLITLGKNGIIGFDHGKATYQRPFRIERPVNTSGAGDTAAGVFLSGILEGQDFSLTLKEASYFSSRIVGMLASRFANGREALYRRNHIDTISMDPEE